MHFDEAVAAVRGGMAPGDAADAVVAAMTLDERLWCVDGDAPTWDGLRYLTADDGYHRMPFAAAAVDRLGVPGVHFADGPRGCVVGNATAFPVAMARGATWDPELEERVGEAIGRELRAAGADLTGAVCINLLRHPAWGRAQETYGEDPHHVGEMAAAVTRGLQRHVMACVKHFACNSMENARFRVNISVDDVALHEVFLPHFRRVVDERVASVMTAYNSVNGEWCGESDTLLRDVLRGEWGFEGFVISDWILGLRDAAASMRAGLDIEMPYRMIRFAQLPSGLASGTVDRASVDAAAARTIATLLRFDSVLSADAPPRSVLGCDEHRALAREVAGRSAVLLRNELVDGRPVLPLAAGASVAVIGRLADTVNLGDGGSSEVWDLQPVTVLEGLTAAVSDVTFDAGDDLAAAADAAGRADVAVVVVGYTAVDEGEFIGATDPALGSLFPAADEPDVVDRYRASIPPSTDTLKPPYLVGRESAFGTGGDRVDLGLHAHDVELIGAVSRANPRTVVVLQSGATVVVDPWVNDVAAVVQAFYGGGEAGHGLADVLTGVVDPAARLPFVVPRSASDLPAFDRDANEFSYDRWHGWWHLARNGTPARFAFGFGLSYVPRQLVGSTVQVIGDELVVTADVHNLGDRDSAEVVQVYAHPPDGADPSRLIAFGRVTLAAGATASARWAIPLERLARRDGAGRRWVAAVGRYRVVVALNAEDANGMSHTVDL